MRSDLDAVSPAPLGRRLANDTALAVAGLAPRLANPPRRSPWRVTLEDGLPIRARRSCAGIRLVRALEPTTRRSYSGGAPPGLSLHVQSGSSSSNRVHATESSRSREFFSAPLTFAARRHVDRIADTGTSDATGPDFAATPSPKLDPDADRQRSLPCGCASTRQHQDPLPARHAASFSARGYRRRAP